jgi:hypothetical protein
MDYLLTNRCALPGKSIFGGNLSLFIISRGLKVSLLVYDCLIRLSHRCLDLLGKALSNLLFYVSISLTLTSWGLGSYS